MRGAVNRVGSAVFVAVLGLAAALVAMPRGDYRMREGRVASPSAGSASASILVVPLPPPSSSLALPALAELAPTADGSELAEAAGSASPELANAPKSLTFGVVLVTYAGAQGAPRSARSKVDAQKLATELAELAQKDFGAAVKRGDAGSTDDAGKMYQGILEPGPEYALFSLEPEHVTGPVETPRGFWIVRRIK